ncbi:MAG: fumarylacetoacetate hydrolase family protein [Myxococcota bacterium]
MVGARAGRRARAIPAHASLAIALVAAAACNAPVTDPRRPPLCDATPPPARLVRYLSAQVDDALSPSYGLVLEDVDGVPTRVLNVTAWLRDAGNAVATPAEPRRAAFARELEAARARWDAWRVQAATRAPGGLDPRFARYVDEILREDADERICAPIATSQAAIESGDAISIGIGLNYAEHAREAGAEDDFFAFAKAVAPTGPYRDVPRADGVALLDYEVELAFVVLEDLDLEQLPPRGELDAHLAYLQVDDVTDREPIVLGSRAHFTEAKSRPGFLPAGPWLVHGADLRPFPGDCARPLALTLEVEEANGPRSLRQRSDTSLMRRDPHALLEWLGALARERLASEDAPVIDGVLRGERWRFPIAKRVGDRLVLPAGSLVATGTPAGIAMQAPSPLGAVARGLARARGPFANFAAEQRARLDAEGYLEDGDEVVARVDALGAQRFRIAPARPAAEGAPAPFDPCAAR